MNYQKLLPLFAVSLALFHAGCATDLLPTSAGVDDDMSIAALAKEPVDQGKKPPSPTITTAPLVVNKKGEVGTVQVWNDENKLYLKLQSQGDWLLRRSQLALGTSLADIPANKKGKPQPAQFPYKEGYKPPQQEAQYELDLIWPAGTVLYISLHARVVRLENGEVVDSKAAWAAGSGWPDDKNFDKYFTDLVESTIIIIIEPPKK